LNQHKDVEVTMAREAAQSHLSFEFSQIQSSLADIQAALEPIQPATAAPIQAAVAQIAAALGRLDGSLQASLNQIGPLQASIAQIQAQSVLRHPHTVAPTNCMDIQAWLFSPCESQTLLPVGMLH
jgi:hypothetical protein